MQKEPDHLSAEDWHEFNRLTSVTLSQQEIKLAMEPSIIDEKESHCLAIHWHPEWLPLDLIVTRVEKAFPNASTKLLIPTQHNEILSINQWAGMEIDCYCPKCCQKLQLLIHFKQNSSKKDHILKKMAEETFNIRPNQLNQILEQILTNSPEYNDIIPEAVEIAQFFSAKLKGLIFESNINASDSKSMLKNRLLADFIVSRWQQSYPKNILEQCLIYIDRVKNNIKKTLKLNNFYRPEEIIEEARSLNAGVIIPHPPRFWTALLAGLDVDGWEVWNSSTADHTLFLLRAMKEYNQLPSKKNKQLLAFMGDDTHMSSKIRTGYEHKKSAQTNEIGFQMPWKDPQVIQFLAEMGQSKASIMKEYKQRLE